MNYQGMVRSGMPGPPGFGGPPSGPPGQWRGGPPPGAYRPPIRPTQPPRPQQTVKRPAPQGIMSENQKIKPMKQKKPGDRVLPPSVRDLVPESQAYADLLHLERRVDMTIMRKRLEMQEALKRPQKIKKKLRLFITNSFSPANPADQNHQTGSWELRVEGRLLEPEALTSNKNPEAASGKVKRKFSTFFKSLVIELDKDIYGPDNHLVEWHRQSNTQETDGFQVKRQGDQDVKCTMMFMLNHEPAQFKLDMRLARLLGIHTATRSVIVHALWQYIKTNKLQDPNDRIWINLDQYLRQIFNTEKIRFADIPGRLHPLLSPPDPIAIHHKISCDPNESTRNKTTCYDIEVEIDDPLRQVQSSFLRDTAVANEIQTQDRKILQNIEMIKELRLARDFYIGFSNNPQEFITDWIASQSKDLRGMQDMAGNPDNERKSETFKEEWVNEAVMRYFYNKIQTRRAELEKAINDQNK